MANAQRKPDNDIDDDPMFDTSSKAKQKAKDRRDQRLIQFIERVERLEEEKKGIADDIRDVWAEAKAVGYDTKIARQIVRLRKMKANDRREMETILEVYKAATGLD